MRSALSRSVAATALAAVALVGVGSLTTAAEAAPAKRPAAARLAKKPAPKLATFGHKKAVSQAIARVTRLRASVAANTAIAPADLASLDTALGSDLAALQARLADLTSATTRAQVKAALDGAFTTAQIASERVHVILSSISVTAPQAVLDSALQNLQAQLATAQAAGLDTTALSDAIAVLQARLDDAAAAVASAKQTILDLGSTVTRRALHAAQTAADSALDVAGTAFDAAQTDLTTATAALDALLTLLNPTAVLSGLTSLLGLPTLAG